MKIKKRKLNAKEKLWLNKLLEAEFKGKEIIIQQLGNTEVFTADLSKINGNDISLDNVEYEINSMVR